MFSACFALLTQQLIFIAEDDVFRCSLYRCRVGRPDKRCPDLGVFPLHQAVQSPGLVNGASGGMRERGRGAGGQTTDAGNSETARGPEQNSHVSGSTRWLMVIL